MSGARARTGGAAADDGRLRLNKFLSERGLCSRREADAWIAAGRVTVNGVVATLGTQAGDGDEVRLDGAPVGAPARHVYVALHKPVGIECTTDPRVAHNIVDFVAHPQRVFPIGRLDKDSEGLILLTNDGDVVNRLLRAEYAHEKEYLVTVDRPLDEAFLRGMANGVPILGTTTQPCRVRATGRNSFRIVLTQGLNRQIRRMCEAFGYTVRRLVRVRFVNVRLDGLEAGQWRDLTRAELAGLLGPREARGAADECAPAKSVRTAHRTAARTPQEPNEATRGSASGSSFAERRARIESRPPRAARGAAQRTHKRGLHESR